MKFLFFKQNDWFYSCFFLIGCFQAEIKDQSRNDDYNNKSKEICNMEPAWNTWFLFNQKSDSIESDCAPTSMSLIEVDHDTRTLGSRSQVIFPKEEVVGTKQTKVGRPRAYCPECRMFVWVNDSGREVWPSGDHEAIAVLTSFDCC